MQGLQEQRPDPTHEHRQIAVDRPRGAARAEPSVVGALLETRTRLVGAGQEAAHGIGGLVAELVDGVPDHT